MKKMNWLVLTEENKAAWEDEATRRVSAALGQTMTITLTLPTAAAAGAAYKNNRYLKGKICWRDAQGEGYEIEEILPYQGVFVLQNEEGREAKLAVWQSYVEKMPKQEELKGKDGKDKAQPEDVTDLETRTVMTFPRCLLLSLVNRLKAANEKNALRDSAFWDRACVVPVITWLASQFGFVQLVRPNNASDLLAQICSIRRYRVSRRGAMGMGPERRQNHPSFDGRICPVDTPESEMVGISLQLARGATIDADGHIQSAQSTATIDRISWGASLIPFSHHNDGARDMMGAKNLRQATPVLRREAPCVRTGTEAELAEWMRPLFEAGICPESRDANKKLIALGCDLLVGYLPWNGWNLDDAIVVSDAVVNRMAVTERQTFSRLIQLGYRLDKLAEPKSNLTCGTLLARFCCGKRKKVEIRYTDSTPATLTAINFTENKDNRETMALSLGRLTYEIEKQIPLGHGDKLMARHGNKGIVGRVVPEKEMPRLPHDSTLPKSMRGKPLEILVNPHGVLSRMNPGQLLETHLGWLFRAAGKTEADVCAKNYSGAIGAPKLDYVDLNKVQELLKESGLDRNGKIKLTFADGSETTNPVVVGYEHFVRLHHIPELKAQARAGGENAAYDSVTHQPVGGRRRGGGQRFGEMEVWALCAHRADHVLAEMLGEKSDCDWTNPQNKEQAKGFERLLKDWLLALCIDVERTQGGVKFRYLTDEKDLMAHLGKAAQEITSDKTCCQVLRGGFSCAHEGCHFAFHGVYPLSSDARRGMKLKFGTVLKEFGFDSVGMLEEIEEGKLYRLPLFRAGEKVGSLQVVLEDLKKEATTLNVCVKIWPNEYPEKWPLDKELPEIYLRAKPTLRAEERTRYKLPKDEKDLKAGYLLNALRQENASRSLAEDFYVVCPEHKTEFLKISPPYERVREEVPGSIFDSKFSYNRAAWGYIKLPKDFHYSNPDIPVLPVLPLSYRPIAGTLELNAEKDEISLAYVSIIRYCLSYNKAGTAAEKEKGASKLKVAIDHLFELLAARLEKKHGFLRRHGLGRRVDRSFRLVIAPNPDLRWDQAAVPCSVLWELMGDLVLKAEKKLPATPEDANICVQKAGWGWQRAKQPADAEARLKRYLKKHPDFVLLLNRQPSLHRDSIQAFHPLVAAAAEGEVLQLSPLCCKGFAADFDGDEMSGHLPFSSAAQEDAQKLLPSRNLRSIATGEPLVHLDRDLVTGLECIYQKPNQYKKAIESAFKQEKVSFDAEAQELLDDRTLAPGEFGQKLMQLWCQNENKPDAAVAKISAISRVAFRACTTEGISFGFFDLEDLSGTEKMVENSNSGAWTIKDATSPLRIMVNSGANGAKQIGQVVVRRGTLATAGENVKIKVSLIQGMSWTDYFAASQNARYSMSQKKIGTQKGGALTRQLVLALWPWTIVEEDCGYKGETRSIRTCQHEGVGVCAKCFGSLPNGEVPTVGFPIGLVAAQSLGERGTQLSMQVFHTGAAAVKIEKVSQIMTGIKSCKSEEDFVKSLRQGAYEDIDERYFQLLWRALQKTPKKKLSSSQDDPWAPLVRGSQMALIRELAKGKTSLSLASPVAKVLFNLFADENMKGE